MAKSSAVVVAQYRWAVVKERTDESGKSYDVWEWNVWKLKWVRLSNTACGYGTLAGAQPVAKERSSEIQDMFDNNQRPPVAL